MSATMKVATKAAEQALKFHTKPAGRKALAKGAEAVLKAATKVL